MARHQLETPQHRGSSGFSTQLKLFLVQLLQQRPLIFWGSVWAIALMLISGSIATLLDPTVSRRVSLPDLFAPPQPIAVPSPAIAESAPPRVMSPSAAPIAPPAIATEQPTLPYRSLGAIVLGCGLGSVLISQVMNRSQKPQRLRSTSVVPKRHVSAPKQAETLPVSSLQPARSIADAPYQMPPALTTPRPTRASPRAAQPAVAVVPPEASHALDWDESSLVNAMDIRKQRSLSSWM